MSLRSIDPATGQTLREYPEMTPAEWGHLLEQTQAAQEQWRQTPFHERAARMRRAGDLLRQRQADYASIMAAEMGKPLAQGRAEAEKCAGTCHYYAEQAEGFLRPETVPTDAARSYVAFEPLGVILAVMPWNFPFWQVIRFAAPALMAGNAGVLKHASNVTGCALALEALFRDAGFPEHLFRALRIPAAAVGDVIDHPLVRAVTLTGSTGAGRAVAARAGQNLKKTVLELGGSDPYLVLDDADLERAADTCAASRLINSGQSCIAAKRFIVERGIRADFERLFVEQMRRHRVGPPAGEGVEVGPLARLDLRESLHRSVQVSVERGARLLLGGSIPSGPGAYYPPTVLTDVRPGMPAYEEELFGPVASVIEAADENEAVRIANDSIFGLGAAVFTGDPARGERLAREELQAGSCFVNAYVKSDPRLPFGGIKGSGYGRELSYFGLREFVNIKTLFIGSARQTQAVGPSARVPAAAE